MNPSYETESEICSMLESLAMKCARYHLALFFPSPSLSASFPFLLLHSLNFSESLLPSTFLPLLLPPFSPGSGMFPSLHWLPLYLQGTNRTAQTGEGARKNKHLVRNNTLNHVLVSLSSRFEWTLVLWRAVPSVCTMTP